MTPDFQPESAAASTPRPASAASPAKRLFHYTRAGRIQGILNSGEIGLATLNIEKSEKPAAWFSYHPHWEPTATPKDAAQPLKQLSFGEFCELETPFRIEIDPHAAPLDWRAWRKLSGVRSKTANLLEEIALRQGAVVSEWRISFEPVKTVHWFAIEYFADGQWKRLAPNQKISVV